MAELHIGHGYDVHRLAEGRALILGGVSVPHTMGLLGHSDADVLCHAVSDALLGALGLGDIGTHFPDSDARYKGADSLELLKRCVGMARERGWSLGNLDATIVAQAPKLAPQIPTMRQNLADAFGADPGLVNVKATTEEHLGFTGTEQGMAAHCVLIVTRG